MPKVSKEQNRTLWYQWRWPFLGQGKMKLWSLWFSDKCSFLPGLNHCKKLQLLQIFLCYQGERDFAGLGGSKKVLEGTIWMWCFFLTFCVKNGTEWVDPFGCLFGSFKSTRGPGAYFLVITGVDTLTIFSLNHQRYLVQNRDTECDRIRSGTFLQCIRCPIDTEIQLQSAWSNMRSFGGNKRWDLVLRCGVIVGDQ